MAAAARRMPYVLDVRDIWPAAAEALGELSNQRVLRVFERAERWLYQHASRVTATTRPFCRHIDRVAGRPVSVHLPNGALDELVEPARDSCAGRAVHRRLRRQLRHRAGARNRARRRRRGCATRMCASCW